MTTHESDDQSAVDDLRKGNPHALAALFSRHQGRLRRMVDFRLDARLRGRVSASDVLQEAYIDALKRLPHFQADPDVPFFIWLRTVTVQRLIDVHRQHLGAAGRDAGREVRINGNDSIEVSSERMAELMGDVTSPSFAAERQELKGRIREMLDRLDPTDREVLAMRHFEELSNQEVAAALGIRSSAASKRYVRAIERLKEALEGSDHSEGDTR